MPQKYEAPSAFKKSFTCPHCGDNAPQYFKKIIPVEDSLKRKDDGGITFYIAYIKVKCHSCGKSSILLTEFAIMPQDVSEKIQDILYGTHKLNVSKDELIYPRIPVQVEANPDMPEGVKKFFNEARAVGSISVRAATGLLRVAAEKLVKDMLGLSKEDYGKTTFANALEKLKTEKKLDERIFKSLNSLKLFGNDADHPDWNIFRLEELFSEDPELMRKLFGLLNTVVDDLISKNNLIDEVHAKAPKKTK